jgi:hypothetical protein
VPFRTHQSLFGELHCLAREPRLPAIYHSSPRRHVREVVHFADWAEAEGLALRDLNRGALNRLCSQLAERNSLRYPCGKQRHICHSAFLLIDFLEEIGAVEARPPYTSTQDPTLLLEFREWMRTQRGTLDITLNGYRQPILDLLDDLGTEPSTFDAIGLLLRNGDCPRCPSISLSKMLSV